MADPWGLVSKGARVSSGPFSYFTLYLQNTAFSKWAMPYRTSDLLLVS
jgi:hypothetical protein